MPQGQAVLFELVATLVMHCALAVIADHGDTIMY